MIIKTAKNNVGENKAIGQVGELWVIEVETEPAFEHEALANDYKFIQRCLAGKYGEKLSYNQILDINQMIADYGESDDYEGLLKKKIDFLENVIDEVVDLI